MCVKAQLTVFFEDPFWVLICEREEDGKLEVARIVFGAEPKDCEVYECWLKNAANLRFSPPITTEARWKKKANPKREKRQISRQLSQNGIGTKAQEALKLQQAESQTARRQSSKEKEKTDQQRKFTLRQEKKKEKHRGR